MPTTIESISFVHDSEHAWIQGTVELSDGRIIDAGGGWIDEDGVVEPYEYAEAGKVDDLAEALGCDVETAMAKLHALHPMTWPAGTVKQLREALELNEDLNPQAVDNIIGLVEDLHADSPRLRGFTWQELHQAATGGEDDPELVAEVIAVLEAHGIEAETHGFDEGLFVLRS